MAALAAGRPASLDGVWGSACALVAAGLARGAARPTLVVVCPTQHAADDLAADLELFTAARPASIPPGKAEPDDRLVHDETFGDRLRVLKQLLSPSPPLPLPLAPCHLHPGPAPALAAQGCHRGWHANSPARRADRYRRVAAVAGRARLSCDDRRGAAGRIRASRRHSRYLRARLAAAGADRAVRRRDRVAAEL